MTKGTTADLVAAFLNNGGTVKRLAITERSLEITDKEWQRLVRGEAEPVVEKIVAKPFAAQTYHAGHGAVA